MRPITVSAPCSHAIFPSTARRNAGRGPTTEFFRRGAIVAIANKMARVIWSMLATGQSYQKAG
ncbi:hypothetical protein BOC42_27775 [Burkholderia pseudomallei]|nr:hypothetical protein BOC42_27775 [Burkholderia pseudomallei]